MSLKSTGKLRPENEYATVHDVFERFKDLVDQGFGELPVQVVVVPDSTMQAIAKASMQHDLRPALMIELPGHGPRMPVCVISADRLAGKGIPTTRVQ